MSTVFNASSIQDAVIYARTNNGGPYEFFLRPCVTPFQHFVMLIKLPIHRYRGNTTIAGVPLLPSDCDTQRHIAEFCEHFI